MKPAPRQGFTLVELLTVIAIIAILAGIVAVALPRALEKAKVGRVVADMRNVSTTLQQYFTENQSYPLPYGFQRRTLNPKPGDPPYVIKLTSYLSDIKLFGVTDIYDLFATQYDTDGNGTITRLEYSPLSVDGDATLFDTPRPPIGPELGSQRPLVYIAVYSQHIDKFRRAVESGGVWNGQTWPAGLTFNSLPPPRLDEAVLLCMGPGENTAGILTPPDEAAYLSSYPDATQRVDHQYYLLALRAYYFATRDLNGNSELDFDYRSQTRLQEGRALEDIQPGAGVPPNGRVNVYGPIIERVK
ncbi:MAG: hypothetical protein AMXMBFR84_41330 [Candidatus Hydrogenedentota bacterium]